MRYVNRGASAVLFGSGVCSDSDSPRKPQKQTEPCQQLLFSLRESFRALTVFPALSRNPEGLGTYRSSEGQVFLDSGFRRKDGLRRDCPDN